MVCEAMGLWAAAHADGRVRLRMLPAGHITERYTITLPRDAPPVVFDDSESCAPFVVHRPSACGLVVRVALLRLPKLEAGCMQASQLYLCCQAFWR